MLYHTIQVKEIMVKTVKLKDETHTRLETYKEYLKKQAKTNLGIIVNIDYDQIINDLLRLAEASMETEQ